MHQSGRADALANLGEARGEIHVDVLEGEVPRLPLPSDHVHDDVAALDGVLDGVVVADGIVEVDDLAEVAHHLEVLTRVLVASRGEDHARSTLADVVHHVSAEETGGAEHRRRDAAVGFAGVVEVSVEEKTRDEREGETLSAPFRVRRGAVDAARRART